MLDYQVVKEQNAVLKKEIDVLNTYVWFEMMKKKKMKKFMVMIINSR